MAPWSVQQPVRLITWLVLQMGIKECKRRAQARICAAARFNLVRCEL